MTTSHSDSRLISSFGAQVVHLGPHVMICGGMGADACLHGQTVTTIAPSAEGFEVENFSTPSNGECMPFMIGCSIVQDGDYLLVLGGGATCFSMGTFWETGVYRIRLPDSILDSSYSASRLNNSSESTVNLLGSRKFVAASATADSGDSNNLGQQSRTVSLTHVPTIQLESAEQFRAIVCEGKPVILKGCNIGECQRKWSPEYLVSQIGANEKVGSTVFPGYIWTAIAMLTVAVCNS